MEPSKKFVYNPYILNVFYMKLYYLNRLLELHYRNKEEEEDSDLAAHVERDCCVDTLVTDFAAVDLLLKEEAFRFDAYHCNFEFVLYRLMQFYRPEGTLIDHLFQYACFPYELDCQVLSNGAVSKAFMRRLIATYIEDFYGQPSREKTLERVELLLNAKHTLEQIHAESENALTRCDYMIVYDKELINTLIHLYFINAFISLVEREHSEKPIDTTTIGLTEKENHLKILGQLKMRACETYGKQIHAKIHYYRRRATQSLPQEPSETPGFLDFLFSTGRSQENEVKFYNDDEEDDTAQKMDAYHENMGIFYRLSEPPLLNNKVKGQALGESALFDLKPSLPPRKIIYLEFHQNKQLYKQYLYRLLFEIRLRNGHTSCQAQSVGYKALSSQRRKNMPPSCSLCVYFGAPLNRTLSEFCESALKWNVSNAYLDAKADAEKLRDKLSEITLGVLQPLTLLTYKALATISFLFNLREGEVYFLALFDPIQFLRDLEDKLQLNTLDPAMMQHLTQCRMNWRLPNLATLPASEQELSRALDVELVKQIINTVNAHRDEVEKYERSKTIEVTLASSEVYENHLKRLLLIYSAHVEALVRLMRKRVETVTLLQEQS